MKASQLRQAVLACFLMKLMRFKRSATEQALANQKNLRFGCADGGGETPVTIPNTEVKPTSGDDTAALAVGK